MGWRGLAVVATHRQKEVDPKGNMCFCYKKMIRNGKQDQKTGLMESIMRFTDPVKEELRRILFKVNRFRSEIQEFRISTF